MNNDIRILQITQQIKQKQQKLLQRYRNIVSLVNITNNIDDEQIPIDFLHDVQNDYDEYYKLILNQKTNQLNAMESLQIQLNNMNKHYKDTNSKHSYLLHEQNKVINEINKIKQKINNIILIK
jgi:translation initiation factor 2B subunit (eIF-2B alpha/beta/delta family)